MNRIILIGNLTKDPEMLTTSNGTQVCKFTLAVQRKYSNSDGTRVTDFLNIVAWRELAENCGKYLNKGNKCAVCGSLQTRSYENKDGIKINVFEIMADEVEFLTPKTQNAATEDDVMQPIEDEDLPF